MACQCYQRAQGVLMFRRGVDLGEVLSKTLKLLHQSSMTLLGQTPSDEDTCITTVEEDEEAKLLSFCNVLNDKIHKQIKYTTTCDEKSPYDISNFSLQTCIENIDPLLWKMVILLTRNRSERRKRINVTNISQQRKIHCLYTLCVIFFNTNRTCSVPLHLLLTDLVEAQGGSSELIRLLNGVGAIASADTHQRYVQFYIERKRKQGILSELNMERFTIVSVDNIDFLQRHAFVYCGDQSRNWHGTTVQAVQPLGMHAGDSGHCTLSLQRNSTTTSTQMTHGTTQGIVSTQMTHGTTQGIVATQSTHGTTQGIVATQSTHGTTQGTLLSRHMVPPRGSSLLSQHMVPPRGSSLLNRHMVPPRGSSLLSRHMVPPRGLSLLSRHMVPPRGSSLLSRHMVPPRGSSLLSRHMVPPRGSSLLSRHMVPPRGSSLLSRHMVPPRGSSLLSRHMVLLPTGPSLFTVAVSIQL